MFGNLFRARYRIKKVAIPRSSGGIEYTYYLQFKYILWPLYQTEDYGGDEKHMRNKMRSAIFKSKRKKIVTYSYNADPIPDHIPGEQKDKYLLEKEKR